MEVAARKAVYGADLLPMSTIPLFIFLLRCSKLIWMINKFMMHLLLLDNVQQLSVRG